MLGLVCHALGLAVSLFILLQVGKTWKSEVDSLRLAFLCRLNATTISHRRHRALIALIILIGWAVMCLAQAVGLSICLYRLLASLGGP
jgi:hypothetical protein